MNDLERVVRLEVQVESIQKDVNELKGDVKEVHSRITTGNREIMEKLEEMEARMEARMKASQENATKQHHEIEASVRADVKTITDRVDVLERWRWMVVGGAIAVGYIASHLMKFL